MYHIRVKVNGRTVWEGKSPCEETLREQAVQALLDNLAPGNIVEIEEWTE